MSALYFTHFTLHFNARQTMTPPPTPITCSYLPYRRARGIKVQRSCLQQAPKSVVWKVMCPFFLYLFFFNLQSNMWSLYGRVESCTSIAWTQYKFTCHLYCIGVCVKHFCNGCLRKGIDLTSLLSSLTRLKHLAQTSGFSSHHHLPFNRGKKGNRFLHRLN